MVFAQVVVVVVVVVVLKYDCLVWTTTHVYLIGFLRKRQCNGFQGRTNKDPDSCYSFWIGATLSILGAFAETDLASTKAFLLTECQGSPLMGGFSKLPNSHPDLLHSFYSLIWLSMEQEQERLSGGSSTLSHDDSSTSNDHNNGLDSKVHEQFGRPVRPLKPIDVLLGIPKDKSPRFLNTNPTPAKCYN